MIDPNSPSGESNEILDSLFHGCVWAAFFDLAAEQGGWPDCESAKSRTYRYYEEALAAKGRNVSRPERVDGHSEGNAGQLAPVS